MKIAIIGGGAAGLTASVLAGALSCVTLFERNDRIGKKLLATGNGRCNLTNLNIYKEAYNSPQEVQSIVERFSFDAIKNFWEDLGLQLRADSEGRVYPATNQASTVLDVLRREIERLGVCVKTNSNVTKVQRVENGIEVTSNKGKSVFDRVIIATCGDFKILEGTGHTVIPLIPSLVPLITDKVYLKGTSGIKVKGKLSLFSSERLIYSEEGEVLLRDYGLSGIAVFNMSHYIARQKKCGKFSLKLDLYPNMDCDSLAEIISATAKKYNNAKGIECLIGIINKTLGKNILAKLNISQDATNCEIVLSATKIAEVIKGLEFKVVDDVGAKEAQVMSGGIPMNEINECNMESKLIKGLYFAGEVCDINGICGGYNLHFAWSTGIIAGRAVQ